MGFNENMLIDFTLGDKFHPVSWYVNFLYIINIYIYYVLYVTWFIPNIPL